MNKNKIKIPSFKETIEKTYKIIKGHNKAYLLIIVFCILAALFSSLAPLFLGYATDSLFNSVNNNLPFNISYIIKILLLASSCYIIEAIP